MLHSMGRQLFVLRVRLRINIWTRTNSRQLLMALINDRLFALLSWLFPRWSTDLQFYADKDGRHCLLIISRRCFLLLIIIDGCAIAGDWHLHSLKLVVIYSISHELIIGLPCTRLSNQLHYSTVDIFFFSQCFALLLDLPSIICIYYVCRRGSRAVQRSKPPLSVIYWCIHYSDWFVFSIWFTAQLSFCSLISVVRHISLFLMRMKIYTAVNPQYCRLHTRNQC